MKKILRITGKILLLLVIVLVFLIGGIFIYNKIMLVSEEALIEKPIGQYVEVDGHKMNIYTEGEGKHTLLFLSGSGTAAPVLDFKSLYSLLSSDYRIVVIEKFGYGFSDVVDSERSFETILRQDREALTKAGIEGPYILCPHSMSGIEAIMWAQNYPDEVEAIVGLDMALPRAYDNWDWDSTIKKERLAAFARELGIVRFFYSDSQLPEKLTDKEKKIYRALAASKAVNTCIINEGLAIPDAVTEIDRKPKPDIPMLMFVSDGHETGVENWIEIQIDYISDLTNAEVIELDCGHYVHNFRQDIIAEKLVEFIEEDSEEEVEMILQIDGKEIPVTWEDNASVDALSELAANGLEIQMSMYGGFEQVGSIGSSIARDDKQTTTSAGDIVLYSGNQIVVFYGSNSWAYTKLGKINLSEDELTELLGNGDVTLTLSR